MPDVSRHPCFDFAPPFGLAQDRLILRLRPSGYAQHEREAVGPERQAQRA